MESTDEKQSQQCQNPYGVWALRVGSVTTRILDVGGHQPLVGRHTAPTAHAPPGSPSAALLAEAHVNTRVVATLPAQKTKKRTHVCSALSSAGGPS